MFPDSLDLFISTTETSSAIVPDFWDLYCLIYAFHNINDSIHSSELWNLRHIAF